MPSGRTTANNGTVWGIVPRPGFTIVELLIVVAILAAVLAVLAEAGGHIRNEGFARLTDDLIAHAERAVSAYRAEFGRYPPDRFDDRWVRPSRQHRPRTEGTEALFRCIGKRVLAADSQLARCAADTDGDRDLITGQPLDELVDGWGRPLLYYHGRGDGPDGPGRPLADSFADGEQMDRLNDMLRSRWVHRRRRPLIDSAGPDGVFDTADDSRGQGDL